MPRKKQKPRADGQFEYKGTVGRDIYGNPIRKSFYSSKSREDAKKKYEAYKTEQEITRRIGAPEIKHERTFTSWATEWLEVYKRPNLSDVSYRTTYSTEVNRLIDFFSSARLEDIKPLDVQKFFNKNQSLSMSTLKKDKFILNAIFESAIDNDLCYKNPAKHAVLSTVQGKRPRRALTDEQIVEYAQRAAGIRDDALLMLLTGIRRGEMLGLMWGDYDAKKRELKIQRSMAQEHGKIVARPPKWGSYRTLPLSDEACAVLDRQPRTALHIFPTRDGIAQDPRTWSQKYKRFARELPKELQVTPHELRHTYGTKLMRDGVDIYTIQKLLGHKSIDVTTEIYVHAETDALRKAVDRAKRKSRNHDKVTTKKSV